MENLGVTQPLVLGDAQRRRRLLRALDSVCKVVLDDYDIEYGRKDDLLDLYKAAAKAQCTHLLLVQSGHLGDAAAGARIPLGVSGARAADVRSQPNQGGDDRAPSMIRDSTR